MWLIVGMAAMGFQASTPLACDRNALNESERKEIRELIGKFTGAVREQRELEDGFAFGLMHASSALAIVARWVELERKCCPFLRFRIDVEPGEAKWRLTVTGPPGAKEVLRAGWK
jgi:hypothetical protein